MKLIEAQITNYRSVEDSEEIRIDQQVCLVGKNEAGKTAILQGITGLNPHPSTDISFDKETDYPRRHLTQYVERHDGEEAVVITTSWEASEAEKSAIVADVGEGVLLDKPIVIKRSYEAASPAWELPINYTKAVENLQELERLTAAEKKPLGTCETTDKLRTTLEALAEKTPRQQALLDRILKLPGKNVRGLVESHLTNGLPQFMYFSHYDRMVGQLRIDNLKERKANGPKLTTGELVFLDFLEFAGTSIDEITESKTYETLNAKCEAASNSITAQLQDYWTQNPHLEIEVRVTKAEPNDPAPFNSGIIARARVKNTLHKVTVPFSERSAGFIWFFSFLVKFAQVRKSGKPLILVLDEPGLTLHGKAQEDLLRYFADKLLPAHQVIFSTHSPFMVPADDLSSARTVEDRMKQERPGKWTTEGTKVSDDVLATDPDTLFPLQGALGYNITQTLFVGKNTLLVEGPSDLLYLQAFSRALKAKSSIELDKNWTICPAGGIDKIQSFVSLFSGAKLEIAAITDFAKSDQKKLDQLRRGQIIKSDRLMTYAEILDQEEADVEDIFDEETFVEVLNQAFRLEGDAQITKGKLAAHAEQTGRQLKKAEFAFRLLPADVPEFDHYTAAEWLIRNPKYLEGNAKHLERTRERAKKIIDRLNAALPTKK